MDWVLWAAIGFVAGFFCGAVVMGLMAMSSRPPQRKPLPINFGHPLEGPSTIM